MFYQKKVFKNFILLILSLLVVLLITKIIIKSRDFQLFGKIISKVETDKKVIALTFDDGPVNITKDILDFLDIYKIKATFFVLGKRVEENPAIAKIIVKNGHQIANHSFSHSRLILKPYDFIKNEILKTNQLIRDSGYSGEIFFRAPYNNKFIILPYALESMNIKSISASIFSYDYVEKNPEKIAQNILNSTINGGIISLHDRESTLLALEIVIPKLINMGYRFLKVDELLSINLD